MATLRKFTFILRDIRVLTYHRQNVNIINQLNAHSTLAVGNISVIAVKNNVKNELLYNSCNWFIGNHPTLHTSAKYFTDKDAAKKEILTEDPTKKLTLFQRFKAMYRDYWYVLVPVHVATSAVWFGGFYYAAKSGIDIVAFVKMLHLSDAIVEKIKSSGHSTAGYMAISYALYKIFTPLRYTVTLGGTTISINYLKRWGYIKPIPKKEELKKMIIDKRHSLRERRLAFKDKMIGKINQKKHF